jgi:DNA-binding NarL/FixJ family response regulator
MTATLVSRQPNSLSLTAPHRVLVVEDHEPFRRVICELLKQREDLLIVGEAADGLDAICQAEALRPDVVMLDIGLPMLSGIEVAGQIRSRVPDAKLMFVSNESSLEVVDQAFSRGAHGYVYKPRALRDVLPVLDTIIRGGQFVSGGLERVAQGDSLASHRHHVVFCSSDAVLVGAFSRFIAVELREGNAVVAVVTGAHEQSLQSSLEASRVDVALAIREQRYLPVNVNELLAKAMVNGCPDPLRYLDAAGDLLADVTRRATDRHARLAACGEGTSMFWTHGHVDAAIQLERLWDEIAKSRQMDILCAFPLTARDESVRAVRSLCAEHTAVEIS